MPFNTNNKHIIVNYHYVREPPDEYSGIHPCSPEEFERQVQFLSSGFRITSIPEVFNAAREGRDEKLCAITFDDGLRDNFQNAVPILKEYKATATFFLIAGIFDGLFPTTHKIHVLLSKMDVEELIDSCNVFLQDLTPRLASTFRIPKDKRLTTQRKMLDDIPVANFKETMNILPSEIQKSFLAKCFSRLKMDEEELIRSFFMSKKEVKKLTKEGFHIGSHGYSHEPLDCIGQDDVIRDIQKSKKILSGISGADITLFSYPQSAPSQNVFEHLRKEGFTHAVTTDQRSLQPTDNPLLVPRYDANDIRDFLKS